MLSTKILKVYFLNHRLHLQQCDRKHYNAEAKNLGLTEEYVSLCFKKLFQLWFEIARYELYDDYFHQCLVQNNEWETNCNSKNIKLKVSLFQTCGTVPFLSANKNVSFNCIKTAHFSLLHLSN